LAFLGPGDVSDELLARLARVATRHPPAVLSLAGAGRFGDRVLWARVAGELGPLARAATRAGERAGFPVEDRPYRAHLTLARGRRQRIDLRPLVAALSDVAGPPWTAAEIVLMRSAQPEYERLAAWPLSGH
jgi:2'-5' RNA ligase